MGVQQGAVRGQYKKNGSVAKKGYEKKGPGDRFKATAFAFMLTYKHHIDYKDVWTIAKKYGTVKSAKAAHERAPHEGPEGTADGDLNAKGEYLHTHVLINYGTKTTIKGQDCFDIVHTTEDGEFYHPEEIHPNIKPINSKTHLVNMEKYLEKEGVFFGTNAPTEQVKDGRTQQGVPASSDTEKIIMGAATLHEAVYSLGIDIKSVMDVNTLRNEKKAPNPVNPTHSNFLMPVPNMDEVGPVVILTGETGGGKTQLALNMLPGALMVSHMDMLKFYSPHRYTGIIFDDMSFAHIPREAALHLLDHEQERGIHVRYGLGMLPKDTKKIFTTNMEPLAIFPHDDTGAIERRIDSVFRIKDILPASVHVPKTFKEYNKDEWIAKCAEEEEFSDLDMPILAEDTPANTQYPLVNGPTFAGDENDEMICPESPIGLHPQVALTGDEMDAIEEEFPAAPEFYVIDH